MGAWGEEGEGTRLEIRTEPEPYSRTDTHIRSSSEPSPFPAVMSLSDWLSLVFPSSAPFVLLQKRRVFRDFILDLLSPNRD